MKRSDLALAIVFLALGLGLLLSASALPEGMGRLPGAGFFPQAIGAAVTALSLLLFLQARRGGEREPGAAGDLRGALGAAGLLFVYLALWGTGLFALRTALFLTLLLRFLGESWKASAGVSAGLTAAVTLAFQYGLRVSLE